MHFCSLSCVLRNQLLSSPERPAMPRVPLAGLSSQAHLGTSAAMSKYCFWPSRGWLCCERIKPGTIFTSVGLTMLTRKQCVSARDVQLQSGSASEGGRTFSDLTHLHSGLGFQYSATYKTTQCSVKNVPDLVKVT